MTHALIAILLILMALFLILLVLVQRGRGGGLAGALGGAGGQSAFGAKAGDTFTKITMWSAFFWIILCVVAVKVLKSGDDAVAAPAGISATGAGDDSDAKKDPTKKADGGTSGTDAPADKSDAPAASPSAKPADKKPGDGNKESDQK